MTTRRITVRKSTMVRPALETPRRRLWLSSLDLVAPGIHLLSVRFYRRPDGGGAPPADEGSSFFDGERMRRALAEALVPFYPLAGRLGRDNDGRLEINCNGEGVLFIEADAADTAVDDYGDFAPTMEFRRLVPAVQCAGDISAFPLLLLQVTYFKCGVSISHFINSWSQLCRGTQISSMPSMDRSLLRTRSPRTPTFQHVEYLPAPPMLPATARILSASNDSTPIATVVDIFKLSRSDLAQLRSQLPSRDEASPRRLSTFAVVAAHVWRCVSLARGLPPEQPTMLLSAVEGRTRLRPPLPNNYFGNVIFTVAPIVEASTVTSGLAADVIQAALDRMDSDYCCSALGYLDLQPDLSALARGSVTFRYNLGLTSWVRLPTHVADFGWGRPAFIGPGGIAQEGLAFVLPSTTGDGSLSVAICLRPDHMDKFRTLIYEAATTSECTNHAIKM